MNAEEYFRVEVAYATPEAQAVIPVEVHIGTTAAEAVQQSGIELQFPEIDLETSKLGIFGKRVKPQLILHEGDRVEIYRPLTADPKVVRRELAAMGKTMGKGGVRDKG
jgi:putative ubiquitin-RnfH superfamily antitoxin RatB of RatAB toxin-antitoxin module